MYSYSSTPPPEKSELNSKYLVHLATLDLTMQEKIELLDIVRAILSHFVDQAFHVQTDQITLRAASKSVAKSPHERVRIEKYPENHPADGQRKYVDGGSNQSGTTQP